MPAVRFVSIGPTMFLRRGPQGLEQRFRVRVAAEVPASVTIAADRGDGKCPSVTTSIPAGESNLELYLPDQDPRNATFVLQSNGCEIERMPLSWKPARHWEVHVVHVSHHDVGYTDLPSSVLEQHKKYLDESIDMAEATNEYPDDARFRILIEQAWSLCSYLNDASFGTRRERMIELLRSGRFEVGALFGNMVGEICGHETFYRALYHTARLRRQYGIPIATAEHNDIPGMNWGMCRLLLDAGIRLLAPGLPNYYSWGRSDLRTFWDRSEILGCDDTGAFWWEAPDGRRLLVWATKLGCGGDARTGMPSLEPQLARLSNEDNYPSDVIRWTVTGARKDNPPYIAGYCDTIREWNRQWAFPHLMMSTSSRFADAFKNSLKRELRVVRGELGSQDYPTGSTSHAYATGRARRTSADLASAQTLAAMAHTVVQRNWPESDLWKAWEDLLWHGEHTFGHHFPCGPTAEASMAEKSLHALRAAALTHDVAQKSMAALADAVRVREADAPYLVVFNPLNWERSGMVRALLREIENCGEELKRVEAKDGRPEHGWLKPVVLGDRWHVILPQALTEQGFDLVDEGSGEKVESQMVEVEFPDEPLAYGAQRLGLGSGSKRYGAHDVPLGLKREIRFFARHVPAFGHRTYRIVPKQAAEPEPIARYKARTNAKTHVIENEEYRLEFDSQAGRVASLLEVKTGRQLMDPACPFGMGDLVVRRPDETTPQNQSRWEDPLVREGAAESTLRVSSHVVGHPRLVLAVTLPRKSRTIEMALHVLKDGTPWLDAHVAFPFAVPSPRFVYEGTLCAIEPPRDLMPGSYWDAVAVQNWVLVNGEQGSVLWSSLDAPLVSLGELWPGYVSPAHSAFIAGRMRHDPWRLQDVKHGWLFSSIFNNNFGTNFAVSQSGEFLFRYAFTAMPSTPDAFECAKCGWDAMMPFDAIMGRYNGAGNLPPVYAFLSVTGEGVVAIGLWRSAAKKTLLARIWNTSKKKTTAAIRSACGLPIRRAWHCNGVEDGLDELAVESYGTVKLELNPQAIATLALDVAEK